jgi:hypothetical protein
MFAAFLMKTVIARPLMSLFLCTLLKLIFLSETDQSCGAEDLLCWSKNRR